MQRRVGFDAVAEHKVGAGVDGFGFAGGIELAADLIEGEPAPDHQADITLLGVLESHTHRMGLAAPVTGEGDRGRVHRV